MSRPEHCVMPKCKSESYDLIYLGYPICDKCWNKYSEMEIDEFKAFLKKKVKLEEDNQEQDEPCATP